MRCCVVSHHDVLGMCYHMNVVSSFRRNREVVKILKWGKLVCKEHRGTHVVAPEICHL
jgi:hypothetical protein